MYEILCEYYEQAAEERKEKLEIPFKLVGEFDENDEWVVQKKITYSFQKRDSAHEVKVEIMVDHLEDLDEVQLVTVSHHIYSDTVVSEDFVFPAFPVGGEDDDESGS